MRWDYRVLKSTNLDGTNTFAIHSINYDDNGQVTSVSPDPVYPEGDSMDALRSQVETYLSAFDKPVLEELEDWHSDLYWRDME